MKLAEATLAHLKAAYTNYANLPLAFEATLANAGAASPSWSLRNFNDSAVLRREWAHNNDINIDAATAMDHDPLRYRGQVPVWGAAEHNAVTMFPQAGALNNSAASLDVAAAAARAPAAAVGLATRAAAVNLSARLFVIPTAALRASGLNGLYLNTLYLPQAVGWLQDHLEELGFKGVTSNAAFDNRIDINADASVRFRTLQDTRGCFGRYTEWMVRELQYYAQRNHGARERWPDGDNDHYPAFYPDRLETADNAAEGLYPAPAYPTPAAGTGPSGAVNPTTAQAIRYWLDKRLRCPVVIFATEPLLDGTITPATDPLPATATVTQRLTRAGIERVPHTNAAYGNLWRHTDCQIAASNTHMFVMDFTALPERDSIWSVNATRRGLPVVIGKYTTSRYGNGPVADKSGRYVIQNNNHFGDEASFTDINMLGRTVLPNTGTNINANHESSTFNIIRGVSYVECFEQMDSFNAYDGAVFSAPLFHWIIGLSNVLASGELGGFIGYLKYIHDTPLPTPPNPNPYTAAEEPHVYLKLLHHCGLGSNYTWDSSLTTSVNNRGGYVTLLRHNGSLTRQRSINNQNEFNKNEANYFRNWHFIYRFSMAGRTSTTHRQTAFSLAMKRLQGLLPLTKNVATGRQYTIAQMFRSEMSLAMLLRWHVNRPGDISGDSLFQRIYRVASRNPIAGDPALPTNIVAAPSWNNDSARWTDANEANLIASISAWAARQDPNPETGEPSGPISSSMPHVRSRTYLSTTRNNNLRIGLITPLPIAVP